MGPSAPSRDLQALKDRARDIDKSARMPAVRSDRMKGCAVSLGCRVIEFELIAGRVKYSGPQHARTTRLPSKFQIHRLELPAELAGRRLDQALAQLLPQ